MRQNTLIIFIADFPSVLSMEWCTCPIRCKGGRKVSKSTRSRHEKEIRDEKHKRMAQMFFPDDITPPSGTSRKRCGADNNDSEGTSNKRTRQNYHQLVRVLISLPQLEFTPQGTGYIRKTVNHGLCVSKRLDWPTPSGIAASFLKAHR